MTKLNFKKCHFSDVMAICHQKPSLKNVTKCFHFGSSPPSPIKISGYASACSSAILTRNKRIAVDSETVCLWLDDHSFDRAMKTLCCL